MNSDGQRGDGEKVVRVWSNVECACWVVSAATLPCFVPLSVGKSKTVAV